MASDPKIQDMFMVVAKTHLATVTKNLYSFTKARRACREFVFTSAAAVKLGKTELASQQLAAAVAASYEVAYRIAKTQKPHTIGEELILPCLIIMVEKLCGLDQAKKLSAISLSNNTIHRSIDDLAADILEQLISEVLSSSYPKISMQFDESTDIASCVTLIGFIRYVHEGSSKEEMLLCEDLPTTTKGADIFKTVDGFLRKAGLHWSKVSQVSVDGAPSMMGHCKGFYGLLKEKNQDIEAVHCVIHRYALASHGLPKSIKIVLDDVIKIVNFVK
ncbi:protein FAM200C-like [Palaemon carinicauda]|uniref:protein FAM200C-like n=1 Tax=Palaemon carinicauda TaxID=392227 RepID=UPI0035B5DCDA